MGKSKLFIKATENIKNTPLKSVYDVIGVFNDIKDFAAFVVTVFSILFTGLRFNLAASSGSNSRYEPSIWEPIFSFFPIKVLTYVLMTVALGWTFAVFNGLIATRKSEMAVIMGHVFSITYAIIFVGVASAMFGPNAGSAQSNLLYLVFSVLGACILLILTMTKLREDEISDVRIIRYQSGAIATFATVAALMTLVTYWVASQT